MKPSRVPLELLEQLEDFFAAAPGQANAAAEKLGQVFRHTLAPRQLKAFAEAVCQDQPASKRPRLEGSKVDAERDKSLQELGELLPHCLDPGAFEALAKHLHLLPLEWAQVWPAFQMSKAAEANALVVLMTLAPKKRGLIDVIVHLVTSQRVRPTSFREAVAQAVPQDMGSDGRWIDEELPPRSRLMRDALAQCFVALFPLCQESDVRQNWTFDSWWSELTLSLQGAAPGAALALVAATLLQLQKKGPLTLELVLRPKRRRKVLTWLSQQATMLPEAQSVASFMTRLGRHSMQVDGPRSPPARPTAAPVAVDVEAEEAEAAPVVETKQPEKVEVEVEDELREAAWYNTAT